MISKRLKNFICASFALIILLNLGIFSFSHDIKPWGQYYTPEKATSSNAFAISSYPYHMDGNHINYYWGDSTAKSYYSADLSATFNTMWKNMITGTESASTEAHIKIIYDPLPSPKGYAGVATRRGGDDNGHIRKGKGDADMT